MPAQSKGSILSAKDVLERNLPPLSVAILVSLLIYLRSPRFFLQPRFWAEEGTLHFAYSFSHNWLSALFQPQVGYLNFWPNFATLLATFPALEFAPLITTGMAFIVQVVPVVLILWSESPLWKPWYRKLFGIAVILFVPLTTEVWLNTINSHNYLAIVTFLILLEDPPLGSTRRWVYRLSLLIAGLTGTLSCFLIPFFVLRIWEEKASERIKQLLILSFCAIIQLILIFSYRGGADIGQRFSLMGISTYGATIWTQSVGLIAFGISRAHNWAQQLMFLALHDGAALKLWGRGLLAIICVFLILITSNLPLKLRIYSLGSYGILTILPLMFSVITDKSALMNVGVHQRLFLAPNIILGWLLLWGIQFPQGRGWRLIYTRAISILCICVLGVSLFWGIRSYPQTWWAETDWVDWRQEVQAWRANPAYNLRIQPPGWFVILKR